MKILCAKYPTTDIQTFYGWRNAIKLAGFDLKIWDSRFIPALDAFDEYEPDIFIGDVNYISRGVGKYLQENPDVITLLYANQFSDYKMEEIAIHSVLYLRDQVGKPDLIFSFQENNFWQNQGFKTKTIQKAADITYLSASISDKFKSDISYIGEYHENSAKYIFPLIQHYPSIRIYSDNHWPVAQYVGAIDRELIPQIIKSSHTIINTDPNSDLPINSLLIETRCLSVPLEDSIFTADELFQFSNIEELLQQIQKRSFTNCKEKILNNYTYSHKMYDLFKEIGLDEEADQILESYYAFISVR